MKKLFVAVVFAVLALLCILIDPLYPMLSVARLRFVKELFGHFSFQYQQVTPQANSKSSCHLFPLQDEFLLKFFLYEADKTPDFTLLFDMPFSKFAKVKDMKAKLMESINEKYGMCEYGLCEWLRVRVLNANNGLTQVSQDTNLCVWDAAVVLALLAVSRNGLF